MVPNDKTGGVPGGVAGWAEINKGYPTASSIALGKADLDVQARVLSNVRHDAPSF